MNEIVWKAACSSGGCVEVGTDDDRVLIRDSKRGAGSPVITFTADHWREFLTAAVEWDRKEGRRIGEALLIATRYTVADAAVCITGAAVQHLHFSWAEWDAFVAGILAGDFA